MRGNATLQNRRYINELAPVRVLAQCIGIRQSVIAVHGAETQPLLRRLQGETDTGYLKAPRIQRSGNTPPICSGRAASARGIVNHLKKKMEERGGGPAGRPELLKKCWKRRRSVRFLSPTAQIGVGR